MDWTNNLLYLVLLTSLTGSLLTLFWYGIGWLLETIGFGNIKHILLSVVLVFYVVPMAYGFVRIFMKLLPTLDARIMRYTSKTEGISTWIIVVWFVGMIIALTVYSHDAMIMYRTYHTAFLCDASVQECFTNVCNQLDISSNRVNVLQSYYTQVPMLVGIFNAKVILPVRSYQTEELLIIFYHELTHYKHHDLWTKQLMALIGITNWFNVLVWILNERIHLWCEFACDAEVYSRFGVKRYYEVLLDMVVASKASMKTARLVESGSELKERVKHMTKFYKTKRYPKLIAALLVMCVLFLSTTTIYAATDAVLNVSVGVYDDTVERECVETDDQPEIYEADLSDFTGTIVTVNPLVNLLGSGAFSWTIPPHTMYANPRIYMDADDTIIVSIKNKTGRMVSYGLLTPDGRQLYALTSGTGSCVFPTPVAGYYQVFVMNDHVVSVEVDGSYVY